ncbi:hypothetical protein B0T16DRAFT_389365 [Cercophora newfieldiana]|uniref:Uncharacterized protein n=1 Tax=Cercophora newfieldiana TaxID=92897 RepID=A0AA39YE23_9PEZI|nr:hypothetical protein B0T16DRAFT_389365 [Cercophora newfieldiana]
MSTIYFIKTTQVESGFIEVHAAKPENGYSNSILLSTTGYHPEELKNGVFAVAPEGLIPQEHRLRDKDFDMIAVTAFDAANADKGTWAFDHGNLYFVETRNAGLVNVYAAARDNTTAYAAITTDIEVPISQAEAGNGAWDVRDKEVYFIRHRNTKSGKVEVWYVSARPSAESNLQTVKRYTTWFSNADGEKGIWRIGANKDLYFIKTSATGAGLIEVHVASEKSGYQLVEHHHTWVQEGDATLGTWIVD